MAVSKLAQNQGTGTTSAATAHQTGYTPAAGDLLKISVSALTSSSTPPTITTPTNWTLMGSENGHGSTTSETTAVFGRWATGTASDNAPTISTGTAATCIWETSAWSGLDSTAGLPTQPTAPFSGTTGSSGTAYTSNSFTTSVANEFVVSTLGGRVGNTPTSVTWGGGSSADLALQRNGNGFLATATQTVTSSGTVVNPTATGSGGNSIQPVNGILSFGFTPSTGGGGGPSTHPAALLIGV